MGYRYQTNVFLGYYSNKRRFGTNCIDRAVICFEINSFIPRANLNWNFFLRLC